MLARVGAYFRALPRSLALIALLALGACYETENEAILANLAEALPYRGTTISWPGGGQTRLAPVAFSKDYRYEDRRSNEVKTGTLRALRIQRGSHTLRRAQSRSEK